MKLSKTPVQGAYRVDLDAYPDDRGAFAEAFVKEKFQDQGVHFNVQMMNMSLTEKAGTVRGMHWQAKPFSQGKIVFSARGRIFDAIVDVRPRSPTFGGIYHLELHPQKTALYIPPGIAHGCQALQDQAMLVYLLDNPYKRSHERGLRPDDPEVRIPWPLPPINIAPRDLSWPTLSEIAKTAERTDKPVHVCPGCGEEQHCHCERDADGRCASCLQVVTEFVGIMIRNMKASRERMDGEAEKVGDLCQICSRETADYMVSRVTRDLVNSVFDEREMVPYILAGMKMLKDLFAQQKGVRDWPLTDKAMADVSERLQSEGGNKGMAGPEGA